MTSNIPQRSSIRSSARNRSPIPVFSIEKAAETDCYVKIRNTR
ncbi:MAG: hypothetical protein WA882_18605 [Geitlerinemataceae cyanobacterium]